MYRKDMESSITEAMEEVKEKGYEEGKKTVMRDIYWFLQTYKNDAGLRSRIEMYLSENDFN